MAELREIALPSGATLKVQASPFAVSKALYVACLEEAKSLRLDPEAEVDINFFKDLVVTAMSSPKIDKAMTECLKKCLYNDLRITADTFEPVEARQDYNDVLYETAKENLLPFLNSLSAQFKAAVEAMTAKSRPSA